MGSASFFIAAICLSCAIDVSSSDEQCRIVGGDIASRGMFPYQVSLQVKASTSEHWYHTCGGSIISSKWILTAAHCLSYKSNDITYSVIVGTITRDKGGTRYTLEKTVPHPKYEPKKFRYDIALLKLKNRIKYTNLIKPVSLPTKDISYSSDAIVSGWGKLHHNSTGVPRRLRYLKTTVKSLPRLCTEDLAKICTVSAIGSGCCFGDSGGPLVANKVQVGVVSYLICHCGSKYPDVYSRVWSYMDWINDVMSNKKEAYVEIFQNGTATM